MAFRFTQREPRDAKELFQWLRELLPDLEVRVLENCEVKTTETIVAHGLGCVPAFVYCDTPHCIAVVRQKRKADSKNVYLYATNLCVVDVLVVKAAQLARLTTAIKNGGYHYPDWNPGGGGTDDHEVKADASDTGHGPLDAKNKAGVGIAQEVVDDGGVKKLQTSSTGLVVAVHGDVPDVLYQRILTRYPLSETVVGTAPYRAVEISLEQPDPAVTAYTFYPCYIPDPTQGPAARFTFLGPHGAGVDLMLVTWTQLGPGKFMGPNLGKVDFGSLDVSPYSFCDGVEPQDDDVFIVASTTPELTAQNRTGLFRVVDCGVHLDSEGHQVDSYPVVERIATFSVGSAYVANLRIPVSNGTTYGGKWWHLLTTQPITLDTTALSWEVLDTYSPVNKSELLSDAQVVSEHASSDTLTASGPAWDSLEPDGWQIGPTFVTLPLGLSQIPAGPFTVKALMRVAVFSSCFAEAKFWVRHDDDSNESPFLTLTSAPVMSTTENLYEWTDDLATPVTVAPTDRVCFAIFAHGSLPSSSGQLLYWTFQDPVRQSRVMVTWAGAIFSGTNDHQQLINRFTDVGAGEDPQHNADGIGPGFLHTPFATATTVSGLLPSPTRNQVLVTVDAGNEMTGIGTENKQAGDIVTCTFLDPVKLIHAATVTGANAPLALSYIDGDGYDVDWLTTPRSNCIASFQLRTDVGITPSPCWAMLWLKEGNS